MNVGFIMDADIATHTRARSTAITTHVSKRIRNNEMHKSECGHLRGAKLTAQVCASDVSYQWSPSVCVCLLGTAHQQWHKALAVNVHNRD